MAETATDYSSFVRHEEDGRNSLFLAVEGMHCAGCAFKIERALNANENVEARVNVTKQRMKMSWKGDDVRGNRLIADAAALGFRFSPITEKADSEDPAQKFLLKCMAVSGFASGNIMIFSLALWFTNRASMGGATRDLMHWVSALIALPAIIYGGLPFFRSARDALRHFQTNMDVPISLAVILSAAMSLFETIRHGEYVYFDSTTMLLFLLLCGRYLDAAARGRARAAAGDLVSLMQGTATVLENGMPRRIPSGEIKAGMTLLAAAGERILADGKIMNGVTTVDTSAITGETVPRSFNPGDEVLGGMLNLSQPILIRVERESERSLMHEITRLMENAEQGNAAYVRLADKVSHWYTPVVHILAFGTLTGWIYAGAPWQVALMNAITVLIITCPCALGLAVPVVQVLASQRLFKRGILLKSADALERLETIDTIIFDKTGTLTEGVMTLIDEGGMTAEDKHIAASLAVQSHHPYAQAIAKAWHQNIMPIYAREVQGSGMEATLGGEDIKLGSARFVGADTSSDETPEIWFRKGENPPVRLLLADPLREDAKAVTQSLVSQGYRLSILSGDRPAAVAPVAAQLGMADARGAVDPRQKMEVLEDLRRQGRHVLMVGDGLNDAPALATAAASMSPASALEIAQNAADVVFQAKKLAPVEYALRLARFSQKLVRQNFVMSFGYNIVAVPLAAAGYVTPLIAAIAMSSSSLLVVFNALRLNRMEK